MRFSPLPFTLRQLQYVVAVAQTGRFRRAAESCHVSQPSLSAQVAEVERMLGTPLFERGARRVLPTPAGRQLVARARRLLAAAGEIVELARSLGEPLAGTLHLGVIPTVGPYLLPVLDPALREAFSELSLVWREEKTADLVGAVDRGELDAAIVAEEADLADLETVPIGRDPFVLAVPAHDALARTEEPLDEAKLADRRVLLLDEGHCLRDQALAVCADPGAGEAAFRATSLPTLVQMVAGGLGVTVLPRLALEVEVGRRRGEVRIRPFAEPAPGRTLAIAFRSRSPSRPAFERIAAAARVRCSNRLDTSVGAPADGAG